MWRGKERKGLGAGGLRGAGSVFVPVELGTLSVV